MPRNLSVDHVMLKDNMSAMELALADELRSRFKDKMSQQLFEDENMFLRFLRARSLNVDAAENMLKNHLKWRTEMKIDTILTEYTPHKFTVSEYFPLSRMGKDLEDSPVSFLNFGNIDCKGMSKSVTSMDMNLYISYYLEKKVVDMKETSAKTGKLVDKWIWVFDFQNYSLMSATHKPTIEIFASMISLYEGNYPERLKAAYIINNSYYFSLFWAVIKPFLSPATQNKVNILGKTGWKEELLKHISPDVLPVFLGGNHKDQNGDPMCKSEIKFGGPVPESFFQYANQTCAARIPGAKKLIVARASISDVPVEVPKPGSTLEWEFVVKNRDIGFALIFRSGDAVKELIPQRRIETSQATDSGLFKCEQAGTYIIRFDNTYSWLHSKEIHFTLSVTNP
ncbi:hypothetical protein JTE90_017395 [Oedothorax gibbosus]|uniref:SEC14-like protein 2 n=1 Tax=Oedothorax gibbosus TaxID=931172 RepID=A0AAV6TW44_9ARAC|nr:hypothetical protein JTE90_017395 [Oedothorax gibbosus]